MPSILPALRVLLFASAMLPLFVIGGCGLKGDLVLPEGDTPSSVQPETEEDALDDDSQNGDDSPA